MGPSRLLPPIGRGPSRPESETSRLGSARNRFRPSNGVPRSRRRHQPRTVRVRADPGPVSVPPGCHGRHAVAARPRLAARDRDEPGCRRVEIAPGATAREGPRPHARIAGQGGRSRRGDLLLSTQRLIGLRMPEAAARDAPRGGSGPRRPSSGRLDGRRQALGYGDGSRIRVSDRMGRSEGMEKAVRCGSSAIVSGCRCGRSPRCRPRHRPVFGESGRRGVPQIHRGSHDNVIAWPDFASLGEDMVQEYGLFIGGKWRKSDGKRFETRNPATGETLATFPLATKDELNQAVRQAKEAFDKWKKTPAPRRGELLLEAGRILRRQEVDLARTVAAEMGKRSAEGRGDVWEGSGFYEYAAGEGRRMFGETVPSELPNKMCLTTRLPVGPVGLITPWNSPMAIPAWKSGAALIAGCSFVLKPSSVTRVCAARFVEVLDEAGFPAGVVNMVTGTGSVVGDGLVAHPDIRAISFTGGVDTGKPVYESAAKKMIKVGLELGGKNPIIAMDDANLELLMDGVMFGAFGTAGQRCTAASRLIVHQKVYDEVVDELVERAEKLRVGNPIDEKTDMGPVASADQEKKVLEYIEIGEMEGDTLLTGGQKLTGGAFDRGFFISPTVFAVDRKKRLAQEEIFGPVLSVLKAKDYEDAVAIANSVKYGLSSSIYTNDLRWAFRAMHELEAGITYVNAPTIGAEVQLPFGGTRRPGRQKPRKPALTRSRSSRT